MDSTFGWLLLLALIVAFPLGWQWREHRRARKAQGQPAPEHPEVPHDGAALFYFHSPLCGACRNMTPDMRAWADEDARVHVVDIGLKSGLARAFGVRVTPTLILVRDGRIEKVLLGPHTRDRLAAWF
ncbi:MAG: thioredoxin family protein [Pseudomonadota bacterium]